MSGTNHRFFLFALLAVGALLLVACKAKPESKATPYEKLQSADPVIQEEGIHELETRYRRKQ